MFKRIFTISTLLASSTFLLAQSNSRFSYGISPSINVPVVSNNEISYSSNVGFGLGLFSDYKLSTEGISAIAKLNYAKLNYGVDAKNTKVNTDNFGLSIGAKFSPVSLDNSSILLCYNTNFVAAGQSIYQGINNTGPKQVNLVPKFTNRFAQNLFFGFEFDLKSNTALQLGYSYNITAKNTVDFIDAQPNYFSLGLNIGLGEKWEGKNQKTEMKAGLNALAADTLYFINRSCEGEMSNFQLDSLLKIHYTFSAFRVIDDAQIAIVQKQKNTLNFAVIGSYYASLGDIPSSGIFLLDKNLTNLDYPYPHFIRLEFDFGNVKKTCLYSLSNAAILVTALSDALKEALN